jgi:hypothetical protein
MRRSLLLLTFLMTVICSNFCLMNISADGKSHETFFPVARVVLTPVFLSQDAAFSFLAEGGPRSYRFNGTLGYIACEQHRFKVGGEYLAQKLRYNFNTGKEHHWMHQWAVGGKYQYLIFDDCIEWIKSFELSGYYANAKSKDLNVGIAVGLSEFRRLAGAQTWNIEAGASIDTGWNDGRLLLAIDYDHVDYKRRFLNHKKVSGVGGTVEWHQPIWCDVNFDLKYQYKRAYDYIEALLNWRNNFECGDLNVGLFANHVFGKERLPRSTTFGVELGFSFGVESLFDDCFDPCATDCCVMDCNDLAAWVSCPAVYMPQVLAIVDESLCTPPTLVTGGIPTQFFPALGEAVSINLNPFFNSPKGSKITYNVTGLPAGITYEKNTGIISGLVTIDNISSTPISVIASDGCGSFSTAFTLSLGSS